MPKLKRLATLIRQHILSSSTAGRIGASHFVALRRRLAVPGALSPMGATVHCLAVQKMPRSGTPEDLLKYENISSLAIVRKVREVAGYGGKEK
jgi:hypothetical protein